MAVGKKSLPSVLVEQTTYQIVHFEPCIVVKLTVKLTKFYKLNEIKPWRVSQHLYSATYFILLQTKFSDFSFQIAEAPCEGLSVYTNPGRRIQQVRLSH